MQKIIFTILDGAAEKGRSAFSLAHKPYLDHLAGNSICGTWLGATAPRGYNVKSLSELATMELMGYSYKESPGRGYLEALGIGLKPERNAVYLRANFATLDNSLRIIDRRAGRDEKGLDMLSKKLNTKIEDIKIKYYRSIGHRGVLAVEGRGLSKNITDGDMGMKKAQEIKAKDKKAAKTARILSAFLQRSYDMLNKDQINKNRKFPANYLLVRGPGSMRHVQQFQRRFGFRACSISGVGIIKGISRYLGIDIIDVKGATGKPDTNLQAKAEAAEDALEKYDFVILHINGADVLGHDKNLKAKAQFIERVDKEVFSKLFELKHINKVVVCDHETSSRTGEHVFGPVPFLVYNGEESNGIKNFDEKHCQKGFVADNVMQKVLQCM